MRAILEIHMLQNFAPSNLNRDDTGSPKDAYFGGTRRGRISSQSLKRAMRMYAKAENLIDEENLAVRTKRLTQKLVELLTNDADPDDVTRIVNFALGGLNLKIDAENGKTQYLVYLGNQELQALADTIRENWEQLKEKAVPQEDPDAPKKTARQAKKDAKSAVDATITKALNAVLDGGKAVDLALFGRMLADLPDKNRDAACQVAHAISTNKIEHDEDFYTAVDDLKPDDNAGADMLGTVEFNSACYYRYAVIDLQQLRKNLGGDDELVVKAVKAFMRASVYALPTGKQNSFAAHQLPSFVGVTLRENASPRSLANAFERAITVKLKKEENSLVENSITALCKEWNELEDYFGQPGFTRTLNRSSAKLEKALEGSKADNLEDLLNAISEKVSAVVPELQE